MKRGFTLIEVSILFVIFLIVAFLVTPLSLDDTRQAKNTSRWRSVQSDFINIFYAVNTHVEEEEEKVDLKEVFNSVISNDVKSDTDTYKIVFFNGTYPNARYRFNDYKLTYTNSVFSVKFFEEQQDNIIGILMYDVNGKNGPNIWGKDVFGYNIYSDRFEPFCKDKPISYQKQDCSKNGTGLCCSNYYLIGGSFD